MDQLFLTSLIISFIIGIVLLHRRFKSYKFSSKAYYILWMIIAIRLILPFDISIKAPIYNFSNPLERSATLEATNQKSTIKENIGANDNLNPEILETNINQNNSTNTKQVKENTNSLDILTILNENLFNIWLAGGVLYLLYNLIIYYNFKSKLKSSLSLTNEIVEEKFYSLKKYMNIKNKIDIRESFLIDSPMIVGLIKPVLVVGENVDLKNIDYIFTHELIHLRRRDIAYKVLIFLATTIHWFNPMVHIMSKRAGEDLELSCDEEVVKNMSRDQRIRYGRTLVEAISMSKAPICTSNFSGGGEMIKKRLDKILDTIKQKSSKPLIMLLILSIMTTSLLIGCDENGKVDKGKVESLSGKLYSYKTDKVMRDLNVSNIISSLDFQKEYDAKSMGGSLEVYTMTLSIRFREDEEIDFTDEKFYIQSAILFALIEDIDAIEYMRVVGENVPQIEVLKRANVDDMTISVLGMRTKELGSSKAKFEELINYYKEYKEENNNIKIPEPIDKDNLSPSEYKEDNSLKGLKMVAEDGSVNSTSLTILLENKSDREILYGDHIILEKEIDGKWYEMPVTENVAYEDLGFMLGIGEKVQLVTEWGWIYGQVDPGNYRIIKKVYDRIDEDFEGYHLAAEFQIGQE